MRLSHIVVAVLADQQILVDRPLADLGLRRRVALSVPFFVPAVAAVLFYCIQAHHSMPSDLDEGIAP